MSEEAAEQLMESFDEKWTRDTRNRFLNRMKHKLQAKERGRRW
jgi:hypothetical protein